jgi:hypothetical protein
MAVTDDVSEHLIAAHADVLRGFRRRRDLTVSAAQQQTMAETWRRYVPVAGRERRRCTDRPTYEPWTGVMSSSHEIPATCPARDFQLILPFPRRPGVPTRPRAPRTRGPANRTPAPTQQPNSRVIQFVVVVLMMALTHQPHRTFLQLNWVLRRSCHAVDPSQIQRPPRSPGWSRVRQDASCEAVLFVQVGAAFVGVEGAGDA